MVGELHVNLIKKSAELKLLLKINYNLDDMEIIIVYSRSREEEKKNRSPLFIPIQTIVKK